MIPEAIPTDSPKISSHTPPASATPLIAANAVLDRVESRMRGERDGAHEAGHLIREAAYREVLCVLRTERRKASTVQATVPTFDVKTGTVSTR